MPRPGNQVVLVVTLFALLLAGHGASPTSVAKTQPEIGSAVVMPEDPEVGEIRHFMSQRGSSISSVAAAMRSHLELSAGDGPRDSGGCHGLTWNAEHHANSDAVPGGVSQVSVDAIVDDVIISGPPELATALVGLQAGGGGLILAAEGQLPAGTIALAMGDDLIVSVDWVNAATQEPTSIYANLAHEIAHMNYETPVTCVILESALAGSKMLADFDQYRAMYLTYIYPEAEIYAELNELTYHSASTIGDDPYLDIILQVAKIEAAFPPEAAALVFEWIRQKCSVDQTLSIEARFYCHAAVPGGSD